MATTPPSLRLSYGLSYDRALFERFGRFREDLREGEDSEFNERIAAEVEVAWPTEVRTAHQNPTRPLPLLRAQFLRGRRSRFYKAKPMSTVVRIWLFRHPLNAILQAIRTPDPAERRRLVAAWPLVPPAGLAYAAGALSARCSDRPVSPRPSRGGEATTPPVLSQSTESGGSSERAA